MMVLFLHFVVYFLLYIVVAKKSNILLLLHRDLVKVSIIFCCSYWGGW